MNHHHSKPQDELIKRIALNGKTQWVIKQQKNE